MISAERTPAWARYGCAVAVTALAVVTRYLLDSLLGDRLAFATLYPAIVVAVWVGGIGPALLAIVLGYLAADWFFIPPRYSLSITAYADVVGVLSYGIASVSIAVLGAGLRASQRAAHEHNRRLLAEIDQRHRIEQALRASDAEFRQLADAMPQIVWTAPPDGFLDYYNERWYEFTGFPRGETGDASWKPILHADDVDRTVAAWYDAVRSGQAYQIEYRFKDRTTGNYRWFLGRALPVRDAAGQIVRWFGTCTDIDDTKRAVEALRAGEARLRSIIETSYEGIWVVDREGRTVHANRRMAEMLGTTVTELAQRGVPEFVFDEDRAAARERISRNLAGVSEQFDFRFRRADGSEVLVLGCASPVRDAAGHVSGALGMFSDITDRMRAEAALKEADRRKDEFLAMLGHELRNPLGPIRNAAQLLKLSGAGDDRVREARKMIERQVGHLARLVDDLLDVSRITRGKIKLQTDWCNLAAIVRDTIADHRAMFDGNDVGLRVDTPEHPIWVMGDRTRLAQILGNVLHNANKFTLPGGAVAVRLTEAADSRAEVAVRDTGVGMDPDTLAHAFESFSQADRSIDRSRGGLGLGLALVRGLVALHSGTVRATSGGPGRGSEVVIGLPLAAGPPPPRPGPAKADNGRPQRILVIEDSTDAARSLQQLLELTGHTVAIAHSGPDGVAAARQFGPGVVLCDIGLPGMDGYAVARSLRQEPKLAGAYLIALTGYGQDEDQRQAIQSGFDLHLTKPVDFDDLRQVLSRLPAHV